MQVKEKLSTPEMATFVRNAMVTGLTRWAKENDKSVKKIGEYIKSMAKIRMNQSKERKLVISKNYSNIFENKIPNWSGKATSKDIPKEIYVVEGDSAGGSAKQARDKRYQEIFQLRGVPANTIEGSYLKMLENVELRNLSTLLTDGKGPSIKAEECPYDKIIIATDADKYNVGLKLF